MTMAKATGSLFPTDADRPPKLKVPAKNPSGSNPRSYYPIISFSSAILILVPVITLIRLLCIYIYLNTFTLATVYTIIAAGPLAAGN